jgi:HD superfamily phosphohydrolase
MEIRDPVHGSIHICNEEIPVIMNPFFQRLRGIKQLGFSEYAFPGATHSRFLHSIGVMHIGEKVFNKLFQRSLNNPYIERMKYTFKMACLLHDIGHAPLSHSTEIVMPSLKKLNLPQDVLKEWKKKPEEQASHEDYTVKSILDSPLTLAFSDLNSKFGIETKSIADLIVGVSSNLSYFTIEGINYFPLLHQLVSSEMDCDRMDYLLRDSYFCGVSYGNYDLDWLLDNLEICVEHSQGTLGISERAVVTFDDFLLSRYHMFIMVYFHYRAVCLEQLLYKYFNDSPDEYQIPGDIEKYLEHDDHYLMKILRKSKNPYARDLIQNKIPQKIFESFNKTQLKQLEKVRLFLEQEDIEYIKCSSSSRLSKYYKSNSTKETTLQLKVVRKTYENSKVIYFNIDEATDLFQKFSKSHAINRLHCEMKNLNEKQKRNLKNLIL